MSLESIALNIHQITKEKITVLLERFGSAENIFKASTQQLVKEGVSHKKAEEITQKIHHKKALKEIEFLRTNNFHSIDYDNSQYPELLKEINDYPITIFVNGDPNIFKSRLLSVVGTRKITKYGDVICDRLVEKIAQQTPDVVIVSGLACGIDASIHRAALKHGLRSIAVIPTSLDDITPKINAHLAQEILLKNGAVVTENSTQVPFHKGCYDARNRIIAGLSMATVVVESTIDGGAMSTANYCVGYGRLLMAVPGRISDPSSVGTNFLIKSSQAQLITSGSDILRELNWLNDDRQSDEPKKQLTAVQTDIMDAIGSERVTEIAIARKVGLELSDIYQELFALECAGLISAMGGRYFKI